MTPLLGRRLVFVTGKGGIGKTTVACALAIVAAGQGRRTLLCEMDSSGTVGRYLGCAPLEYRPREVLPRLSAMSMDPRAEIREYLSVYSRVPIMGRIGPVAKAFDFVAAAAPGVREMLVVGKLADEAVNDYDLVVVDSAASGNIAGLLGSPQVVNEMVSAGPIRSQSARIAGFLSDPERTGLVAVTTAEEMPVNETLELAGWVSEETAVTLTTVIANRVAPEPFGREEQQWLWRLSEPEARDALERLVGGSVQRVLDAARLAVGLQRTGAKHLERLRARLDPAVSIVCLPLVFSSASVLPMIRRLSGILAEEI